MQQVWLPILPLNSVALGRGNCYEKEVAEAYGIGARRHFCVKVGGSLMEPMVFQVDQRKVISGGKEIYNRLREKLEPEHKGQIVAIEVDSGGYFLGRTVTEATSEARKKHPDKVFYFVRVGFPAVYVHR